MKRITIALAFVALLIQPGKIHSQDINWNNLKKDHKHLLNVNAGLDYGLTFGARYGYQLESKIPVILVLDLSVPSGEKLVDDFKTRIGGYIRLCQVDNFQLSGKIMGVFRRYENSYVRLLNFGSE